MAERKGSIQDSKGSAPEGHGQQVASRECAECLDGRDVVCRRVDDEAGLWLCALHYAKARDLQVAMDVPAVHEGSRAVPLITPIDEHKKADDVERNKANVQPSSAGGTKQPGSDVSTLTPLSPAVMERQATINIGTIGHVAHGKSTIVKAITGVQTVRFKQELQRNITIKLGYANAKIFKCDNPACPRPGNYKSYGSHQIDQPRHVSFVDCPGHDTLMATMLNGAAVMDAAVVLIAGNTSEHLAAVEIMKLKNLIVLQNKIDLVKEKEAASQYEEILSFVRGTVADGAPIVPISAQLKYNIDVVCEYICTKIPVPLRDFSSFPHLIVVRSFDVNKPGEEAEKLKGGVAGGSLLRGVLRVGQQIEVRPGIVTKDSNGAFKCIPLVSTVVSLCAEQNELQYAVPGGLIGVGTMIDPMLTRADRLMGQVLGAVGHLPEIFIEVEISYFLLRRLLGVKSEGGDKKKQGKIPKLSQGESLMMNIGSTSIGGRIVKVKGDLAKVTLTAPVCSQEGEKVALSRRIDKHWRLIGWGLIRRGTRIVPANLDEDTEADHDDVAAADTEPAVDGAGHDAAESQDSQANAGDTETGDEKE